MSRLDAGVGPFSGGKPVCLFAFLCTESPNPTYFANVMSKVNMKLRGVNQTVDSEVVRRQIGVDMSTLVLGVEVSIFAVGGEANRRIPAVCACTGNLDDALGVYGHAVSIQTQDRTGIAAIAQSVESIVRQRKAKQWPTRILYIRSGVSESRFDGVLRGEVRDIESLYSRNQMQKPEMVVIVAQRRQQTRLYPTREMQSQGTNLPPGFLVSEYLEQPGEYPNFFLISHQALQGTVRPTRYFVLRNDPGLTVDSTAQLLYALCHLYGRCQRTVSVPAPLYYAQLLAQRARIYMKTHFQGTRVDIEALSDVSGESGGAREAVERITEEADTHVRRVATVVRPMCYC